MIHHLIITNLLNKDTVLIEVKLRHFANELGNSRSNVWLLWGICGIDKCQKAKNVIINPIIEPQHSFRNVEHNWFWEIQRIHDSGMLIVEKLSSELTNSGNCR